MTLTEKYIGKIKSDLEIKQRGLIYEFPCPHCRYLPTKNKGKLKPNKKTAAFIPNKKNKFVYTFTCMRNDSIKCKSMSFEDFLLSYRPALGMKYQFEKQHCR